MSSLKSDVVSKLGGHIIKLYLMRIELIVYNSWHITFYDYTTNSLRLHTSAAACSNLFLLTCKCQGVVEFMWNILICYFLHNFHKWSICVRSLMDPYVLTFEHWETNSFDHVLLVYTFCIKRNLFARVWTKFNFN